MNVFFTFLLLMQIYKYNFFGCFLVLDYILVGCHMIIKNENFNNDNKIIKEYSYKRVFVSFIFALLTQIY